MDQAEFDRLMAEAETGQLLSISPTVGRFGERMADRASARLKEERRRRNRPPISLGRGILYDSVTGETIAPEAYQESLQAEADRAARAKAEATAAANEEWERRQKIRDAAAMERAETRAGRLSSKQQEEKSNLRYAIENTQHLMGVVEQNPDAFGPLSDISEYMGDTAPAFITEATRNIQEAIRSPEEKQARATLFTSATERIKDLAGAAQSVSETNRILRHEPHSNDSVETILAKLRAAQAEATRQYQSRYGTLPSGAPAAPQVVTEQPSLNTPAPSNPATPEPVGEPYNLSDGTVWQDYSDGSTRQVQ